MGDTGKGGNPLNPVFTTIQGDRPALEQIPPAGQDYTLIRVGREVY